jgi:glycosyltransferase involved in cell wall biosynthesis
VDYNNPVRFTFFGAYDPAYPRNAVLRTGLARLGAEVAECRSQGSLKAWARYPLLAARFALREGRRSVLFVPEFAQKDVPLAKLLGLLTARPLVFDPLAARFETKIVDWGWRRTDTPAAWWNFKIDAAAFRLADLVLADTAAHREYYCRTYRLDAAKVAVVPLGYDDALFRPTPAPVRSDGAFTVLFFGSFLPLHGVEVVVEAARLVAAEDPAVRFRIVGDGRTFPEVRAAAKARGSANIEFAGRVPLRDLPGETAAADICLGIFGRTEKARRVVPHKVIQSLGAGRPVITARTPAVEEFFRGGEELVLCDEPLAEALARSVLELKRDPARRERLARAGHEAVRRGHSPEAVARHLIAAVLGRFGEAA